MWNRIVYALASALALAPAGATASTKAIDAAFGSHGFVALTPAPSTGYDFSIRGALAIEPSGGILIGGRVQNLSDPGFGASLAAIGRLHDDGSWDETFGDHGVYVLPYGAAAAPHGGEIHNIVVLPDGRMVAAGGAYVDTFGDGFATCTLLLGVTASGTPDPAFAPDRDSAFCFDFAPDTIHANWVFHNEGLVAGADDTIYLTTPYTNLPHGAVAHFNASGAPAEAYGDGGIAALPDGVFAARLQLAAQGRVVVIGGGTQSSELTVVGLDATGQLDDGYGYQGSLAFDAQPGGIVSPMYATIDSQQRLLIADNDEDHDGNFLPFRFARLIGSGALDADFNSAAQQPGFPGFAAPVLTGDGYFEGVSAVFSLADGHLLGVGDTGFAAAGDGATNLALVRLNKDSGYDTSFGDAAHPGWASLNIGGGAGGFARVRATAASADGRVFVAVEANDGAGSGCAGILRLIADRLFDAGYEPAAAPGCPQ